MMDLGTLQAHIKLEGVDAFKNDLSSCSESTSGFSGDLDNLASTILPAVGTAIAGAFAVEKIVEFGKKVVDFSTECVLAYGEIEQLEGGLEKIFGEDAQTVIENANSAFEDCGMSIQDYEETVLSFSARLVKDCEGDTQKAVEYADTAIKQMSDISNAFGVDMESVEHAYQGFAKENYTMLDNLKLGYAGTKEGMEQLLADAEKISGVHYDITNFNDVIDAIQVIIENMGVAGTTQEEASKTIEGSLNKTKNAWKNLVQEIGDPQGDVKQKVDDLFDSIWNFADNVDLESLSKNLLDALTNIVQKLKEPKTIQIIADTTATLVSTVIQMIPDLLVGLADVGIAIAIGILKGVAEGLLGLPEAIMKALGGGEALSELEIRMQEITNAFSNGYYTAEEYRQEMENLRDTFIESGGTVAEFATAVGELQDQDFGLNETNQQVVAGLSDLVAGMEQTNDALDNTKSKAELVDDAMASVSDTAGEMGTAVSEGADTVNEAIDGIETNVDEMDLNGDDKGKELTDGIATGIEEGYPDVDVELKGIQDDVGKRSYIEQGKAIGRTIVMGIKHGITAYEGNVKQWFEDLDTNVITWVGDLSNLLYNHGKDALESFYNGANDEKNDEVEPFFSSLGNDIIDAVGYMGDLLFDGGYAMMAGMARGISEGASYVINEAVWVAQEAIRQTNATLGIQSPSKVFAKIGEFVDKGLALGITNGAKGVFDSMTDVANGTVGAYNPQFGNPAFATASASGIGDTVYNIYIDGAVVNDDLQIKNQFQQLLLDMARKGMM